MDEYEKAALERQFRQAFYVPAHHNWKSKRGHSHWIDLEVLRDGLAGPLYGILETGGCSYVYGREDVYFCGVDTPAALRARLQQWHIEIVAAIDRFVPAAPSELADLVSMRKFASDIWTAVEAACEIERRRWENVGGR
ncbi:MULTISPECIES: hypothetical protein [unclassified Sphingopyxis]|uniref:hypothetical protein n=1 Tax=unclassified Sphingopyxis TaxID=2614943 RepID=UPI000ADE8F48|nr:MULTISPECIES: hypothetical protein [unclassified Sphingopyxis]